MRKVVYTRLQKKVEYISLIHPKRFEDMNEEEIQVRLLQNFGEFPSYNSVSKAKTAVRKKIKERKVNEIKAAHHDSIHKFVRAIFNPHTNYVDLL
jgi:competence protein ComGF